MEDSNNDELTPINNIIEVDQNTDISPQEERTENVTEITKEFEHSPLLSEASEMVQCENIVTKPAIGQVMEIDDSAYNELPTSDLLEEKNSNETNIESIDVAKLELSEETSIIDDEINNIQCASSSCELETFEKPDKEPSENASFINEISTDNKTISIINENDNQADQAQDQNLNQSAATPSDLFKDVKFAICEDIADVEHVKKVLISNGAKFLNYLSDSATHLIADNPEHLNVSEAIDIYEKPVVTSQWVWLSLRANKVLPITPFSPFRDQLFSNVTVCPSKLGRNDVRKIWSMVTYFGGSFQTNLDKKCTHLVTANIFGAKYELAQKLQVVKIVTPDWVVQSVQNKALCDENEYNPKLLVTYNAGKNISKAVVKEKNEEKKDKSVNDEIQSIVEKKTQAVTMTISTESVTRKTEPLSKESLLEQQQKQSSLPSSSSHSTPSSVQIVTQSQTTVPPRTTLSPNSNIRNPNQIRHLHLNSVNYSNRLPIQQIQPHLNGPHLRHPRQLNVVQAVKTKGQQIPKLPSNQMPSVHSVPGQSNSHMGQFSRVPLEMPCSNSQTTPMTAQSPSTNMAPMQQQVSTGNYGHTFAPNHPSHHQRMPIPPPSSPAIHQQSQSHQINSMNQAMTQQQAQSHSQIHNINPSVSQQPQTHQISNINATVSQQPQAHHIPNINVTVSQQPQTPHIPNMSATVSQQPQTHHIPNMSATVSQQPQAHHISNMNANVPQQPQAHHIPNMNANVSQQSQTHQITNINPSVSQQTQVHQISNLNQAVSQQTQPNQISNMNQAITQQQPHSITNVNQVVGSQTQSHQISNINNVQQAPRQVYLSQQQQMFNNQFSRQFVASQRINGPPNNLIQVQQRQMQPNMGKPQVMPPSTMVNNNVSQAQQMYRHQQFQQMQRQRPPFHPQQHQYNQQVMGHHPTTPQPNMIQGQMPPSQAAHLYQKQQQSNMIPQQAVMHQNMQRVSQPSQQMLSNKQTQPQSQQSLMNQNQYPISHHNQQQQHPQDGSLVTQQQQYQQGPKMGIVRISLSSEQVQKMSQQQNMAQSSQQIVSNEYSSIVNQQSNLSTSQQIMRPSVTSAQQSQMAPPNNGILQQRMVMKPSVQMHYQMSDAHKQQISPQGQLAVRPMIGGQVINQQSSAVPSQQMQYVRQQHPNQQRWPTPSNPNEAYVGPQGPSQYVHVGARPVPLSGVQPGQMNQMQQQQIWIRQQQARRFPIQSQMLRVSRPANGMPALGPQQPQLHHPTGTLSNLSAVQHEQKVRNIPIGNSDDQVPPSVSVMSVNVSSVNTVSDIGNSVATNSVATTATGSTMVCTGNVATPSQQQPQQMIMTGPQAHLTSQQNLPAAKTILVSVQTPLSGTNIATSGTANLSVHQSQQQPTPTNQPMMSSNCSLSTITCTITSSTSSSSGSVVNEKTKTALTNLLNNRLNLQHQNGHSNQHQSQSSANQKSVQLASENSSLVITDSKVGLVPASVGSKVQLASGLVGSSMAQQHQLSHTAPGDAILHPANPTHPEMSNSAPIPSNQLNVGGRMTYQSNYHQVPFPSSSLPSAHVSMNFPPSQTMVPSTPYPNTASMCSVNPAPGGQHGGIPPQHQPVNHSHVPPQPPSFPTPHLIQIRFYGHESRGVIPPELCFVGCVFYIAPSYTDNPITKKLIPGWRRKIERFGGRVVDHYVSGQNSHITHVITENMHGFLPKQALQDGKRCVSIFWLDDVLSNQRLLPPWRFYHLPVAYNQNRPCRNHIISISNFEGEERTRIEQLILRTGAKYTKYLSSKNTILICKRLEGPKYEKAMQWRIAIVNLLWLQDVLFAHFEALQLATLPKKYQLFDQYQSSTSNKNNENITPSQMLQRDIFRVEYGVIQSLMNPWRVPIKYDDTELSSGNPTTNQNNKLPDIPNSSIMNKDSNKETVNTEIISKSEVKPSEQQTAESTAGTKRTFETMSNENECQKEIDEKMDDLSEEKEKNSSDNNLQSSGESLANKKLKTDQDQMITTDTNDDSSISQKQSHEQVELDTSDPPMTVNKETTLIDINEEPSLTIPKIENNVSDSTPTTIKETIKENNSEENGESNGLTENSTEDSSQFKVPFNAKPVYVLFTAVDFKERESFSLHIELLGGKVVTDVANCTHLVVDNVLPTFNFFCAFSRVQYVVNSDWLHESIKAGKFVDEKEFPLKDPTAEQQYNINLTQSISTRKANLFQDIIILLTRSVIPSPCLLKAIIESNGGTAVMKRYPTKRQLALLTQRKLKFLVVTCENDLHMCDYFFNNQIEVVSIQFIFNAILKQKLEFKEYSLSPKK